ncbi:MAG: M23 family metallopeptidase [Myxococcales bacterium]|nr:M23 family metallopeptidase [Myxococcales bacterium]
MKHYTLILVGDETSPIRRIQVSSETIKRMAWGLGIAVLVFALASFDYYRARIDNAELAELRVRSQEQTSEMERVRITLDDMTNKMAAVRELERKVRIIANLPGSTAVGGDGITEVVPDGSIAPDADDANLRVPVGVPVSTGEVGDEALRDAMRGDLVPIRAGGTPDATGLATKKARAMRQLDELAKAIGVGAEIQTHSLEELMIQLEDKHSRLTSMPSIWPTRGWLTSRFGPRISPFTGRRQHHAGIDIASATGADIVAPAAGRVVFVGRKGPLGNTVVVEHGFGVRTLFGHAEKIHVKIGQELKRGELLASVGSTGRSTGPHVHYVVEVNGKARNPLDYIFD